MKIFVGFAALASVAFADITFNVIGYPSTSSGTFGVSIGGAVHRLVATEDTFPVHTGTVAGVDGNVEYSYVELDNAGSAVKAESFSRKLQDPAKDNKTLNEFFERQTTVWDLPKIPYTYMAHYPSKTKAFKHKQIATIHVTAPQASIDEMNNNVFNGKGYKVDFRFINSKVIHSQANITLKTAGKSSKEHQKQSFKFKFDTDYNQTFFHRPNIKLRSMVMDPTMMREKLYIDMLNSAGIPTQQGAWVRLFVNNKPYGLYLMVDDIKKSFLKQTVHQGDGKIERGSLVQMNAFNENKATLEYQGPHSSNYDQEISYVSQYLGKNPKEDPLKDLIELMKSLQDFDPASTPDPVGFWNNTRLDLDGVLRNMALEYLAGAFDNYWLSASNYFMYMNPTVGPSGKWQWLPTDFDGTFGNGAPSSRFPSYKNWYDMSSEGPRPLVSKLILQNQQINGMFEQVLKELITTAFKPEALVPRIQAYNKMLSDDAKWDIGLKRHSDGINNGFTFEDFNNNLNHPTKDMTTGVIPWVTQMSALVANELGFQIPAGLVDRVPPPPKNAGSIDNDDDEDEDGPNGDKQIGSSAPPSQGVHSGVLALGVVVAAAMFL
ncbi:coth-domain-containing protein [Linnemannia elongata AG-77]|uniref:Coth-domain-containing protein n=1 Tax=Linnemannia elongata AG-77 TaxID=1314771 RepID=A0A197JR38_9FUNG|nr:coth-domain-containing protein [Linnemannia elongata AG-77]